VIINFGNMPIDCKAIAFDKDGTLIDRYAFWRSLYGARIKSMEGSLSPKTVTFWSVMNGVEGDGSFIDSNGPLAAGTFEQELIVLASAIYMNERTPWDEALQQAHHLMLAADQIMQLEEYIEPLPGVPEKLLELSQAELPLCIITSDIRDRTMDALRHFGLEERIAVVITPSDVVQGKPAPEMVFKAAAGLKVDPREMVVVGDSSLDMQMAKAAGSYSVAVKINSDQEEFEHADVEIESIKEIHLPPT
jgi:phosphoglycolate phosphatase